MRGTTVPLTWSDEEEGKSLPAGTKARPMISVLMGMYNCGAFLSQCLDSLLAQTFQDWELIACDDGSRDDTWKVVSEYARRYPGRIRLLRNDQNQGLGYCLNRCIQAAEGEFLARQDADDTSLPDRFAKQVRVLRENPQFGWVSTGMTVFDETGDIGVRLCKEIPSTRDLIRAPCFVHAAAMFRAEVIRAVKGYKVSSYLRRGQDYDLWMRLFAAGLRGFNLREPLYRVREDGAAYARKTFRNRMDEALTRFHGYRAMGAPLWAYLFVLRPLAVGVLPLALLRRLHVARVRGQGPKAGI